MKYKVAFCQFPYGGWSRKETNAWVVRTVREMDKDLRIEDVVSITSDDTPAHMVRNAAVLEAREKGCSHILMLDNDMVPDLPGQQPFWKTAWEWMMSRAQKNHDMPQAFGADGNRIWPFPPAAIAAPYCGPPPHEVPFVFQFTNRESDHPNVDFQLQMVSREHAASMSGLFRADALPTGLILFDARIFDTLPPPWFQYEFKDKYQSQKATTEDIFMTRNASCLDMPMLLAMDCWSGHWKGKVVGKPTIVTRDMVHFSLRQAVLRSVDSQDRLVVLNERIQRNPNMVDLQEIANLKEKLYSGHVIAQSDGTMTTNENFQEIHDDDRI